MNRLIYACLLRLHPREFRQKFEQEMLWIFDQAAAGRRTGSLFSDAMLSLWRQWVLRPRFQERPRPVLSPIYDGLPMFCTGGSDTPRISALIHGAVLSVLAFSAVCYILSHSNSRGFVFLVGSHNHSFSHFLATRTVSAAPTELKTQVKVRPEPGAPYYRMPMLAALDIDNDGIISASEIARAPVSLLTLDKNHDNRLDAGECGLQDSDPTDALRRAFMRASLVLAALDSNHDGEISASEILDAPAALLSLDRNHDGQLTEGELIPAK